MTVAIAVDARQLRKAARVLRETIPKDVRNDMNRALRTIGRELAAEAVAAARFHIDPAAVSVRTSGNARIRIIVRKVEAKPHHGKALAFEHGGKPGRLRHPVYGHRDRWTDKNSEARPFLTPVAEAKYTVTVQKIGRVVEEAFGRGGFH